MPSARLRTEVNLPVPASAMEVPDPSRLTHQSRGESYRLTPRSLIPLAFSLQPDIKASYQRFKSEEARYDFFYTSRDSLTPRLRISNDFEERRTIDDATRDRTHTVEVGIEKLFFDTTELNVAAGYRTDSDDGAIGNRPFVSADLRYPFAVSREKLERTSEDIFRRNELDDAQLDYIQQVRRRLRRAMFGFYEVVDLRRRMGYYENWLEDLEKLPAMLDELHGRDTTSDRSRIGADIARVTADRRNVGGRFDVDLARLKANCGLAFHVDVELVDEHFNPFENADHEELLRISIDTDPEISTLRNSQRNAEVQLDLAQRGRWDLAMILSGASNLEGRGERDGISDWSVSVGLDVSVVDTRVTNSLIRQAQASIARFSQAIAARENDIFVDTLEPLIRIETLGTSRMELIDNLPRYVKDYETGIESYRAGTLNIDDLLKRRETLFDQEEEISRLIFLDGANVAELCAATGKFFELLDEESEDSKGSG